MTLPLNRAQSLALLHLLTEQAQHSAGQRAQEDAALTRQLLALRIYRDSDSATLASAIAEQTARAKLADQARRKAAAARTRRAELERSTR